MYCFKVLVFSFLLLEMLPIEASLITDLLTQYSANSTNTSSNQSAILSTMPSGNCPICICQCTPIVFTSPSAASPCLAAAAASNSTPTEATTQPTTTLAPTTQAPITDPPTTLAPTTTPKINVCTTTYQVKTAANVNYKMLCYVAGNSLSTANAAAFCATNGMKLYELKDADSVTGYQLFVNSYVLVSGPLFIGNGIKIGSSWMLYTDQTVPLHSSVALGPSRAAASTTTPNFLYGRDSNMAFVGYGYDVSSSAYFMCQY